TEKAKRWPAASRKRPSEERWARRRISGEPIHTNGGSSIAPSGGWVAAQCSRSSLRVSPGVKPATRNPWRGAAIVSPSKYHSAWGIAAQSLQRPVVRRKSLPSKRPIHEAKGEVGDSTDSGTGFATCVSIRKRRNERRERFVPGTHESWHASRK